MLTSNSKAEGRYDKSDFAYEPQRDAFRCPAGEYAIRRFTSVEKGMAINKYWSSACPSCALKAKCTTATYRRIGRWEHEHVLDQMQRRLDANLHAMKEHSRASVRNDQGMDGRNSFPMSRSREGERRDELACSRLQLEASDEDHGNQAVSCGATRLISVRICQQLVFIGTQRAQGIDLAIGFHTASARSAREIFVQT